MAKKKIPQLLLIIALVLVIVGSGLASVFNTGLGATSVSRISFDTERGTLSGLLYMPKGAGENDPRPTVIVTHGYLNSAEMQDANAIELSRRGYVVLALDMYDHGHSAGNAENTGNFLSFWPRALYDAVQYMYEQPYVLKDAEKNGIIGVTGHSMGGFSSSMAMFYDEQDFAANGFRKIYCGLSEGSDFSYTSWLGLTVDAAVANAGGRTMGKLAAQYDEFFFNADDAKSGQTVVRKNYVGTTEGKKFLEQEAPEAGVWYDTADGGRRIIYQPAETHPWNHFSTTSTGYAIEFYNTAFADFNAALNPAGPEDQVWLWKEIFELVALVGLMLAVVPATMLVLSLPFFKSAKTQLAAALPSVKTESGKVGTFLLLLFAILLPAIYFPTLMDKSMSSEPMMFLCDAGVICAIAGIAAVIYGLKGKKSTLIGGIATIVFGAMLAIFTNVSSYSGSFWPADSVNQIAYWTLICAIFSGLIMSIVYTVSNANRGATAAHYGLKTSPVGILASLCTALVVVAALYVVVFAIDAIFKTDFRIWVFAFKTFEFSLFPAIVKYIPTFLMYYIISTVAICINTNTEKLQGWKGYAVAIALNCGGITLFLLRQYITLFATGVAPHPTQALSSILLVAMVPTLAIAACFSRALYKRTGNIWTPAFLNGILMTVMTVANTCVYFQ